MSEEQLESNTKGITVKDVQEWVDAHDGLEGRFTWLEAFGGAKALYQQVLKPLLSIGSVGSISTERSAKGLKKDILCNKRNRLSTEQALVLYRASENLRYLMDARIDIAEKIDQCMREREENDCLVVD